MTPRQRIAAGVVAACCAIAAPVISRHEGTVLKTYPDPVLGWKVPTACTGHTGTDIAPGDTFTQAECDQLLTADLRGTYDGMLACIGDVNVTDNELAALISLAFNVGPGAFCKGSFATKLKAGDHAAACETIKAYRFVGGKDCALPINNCRGIVRRREAEYSLCMTP